MEDDRIVYTLPDGRKKYIPQNLAAKFEQQNPMATQAYQDGTDIYDIPVRDRNDFLKEFPKATLYSDQQQTQEPADQQEPIQQPASPVPQQGGAEQQRQEDNKPEGWDQRTEDFDKDYQAAIGDINARLEAKRNEAVSRQQEREGKMGRFVSSIVNAGMNENGGAVTPEAREEIEAGGDDEARALRSAAQFYEEAKKTREAAVNGAGFGKGLADAFTIDNWDFGITDLVSNASLYNAAVKEEKGEKLTDAEQALLDAAAHKVASDMYYGNFLGRGYKSGLTTGESLPFMAEFMMNPAAGGAKEGANVVTRALGRAISKKIGAEYGTKVARDIVAKPALKKALQAGGRVLGDVEASAIMSGTTGLGGTIADTYDRMTGDIKFKETEDGIKFDGIDGDMGQFWPSFGKAYGARTIENFSEMFGDYFLPIGKTVGGIVRGVNKSLHLNRVNDFINGIGTAEWMTAVNHFLSKTHWDGIFGETGEELVGGVLNALTVGDQTVGEVFDKDNLIDTFLGVSAFGGFVSAVKTVGYRTPRQQMQIARDKLAREAAPSFATEDDWIRIRQQIDNADEMQLRDILSVAFEEGSQYTPEQKTFIGQYARMREQQIGYDKGRARKEEEMPNFADIDAIYDAAVTTVDPEEKRAAKVEYDNALADLSSLPKEEIDALNQDPGYTVMLEADFPEMAPALERYVKARAALVGINDSINKAMEDDMQRAHDDIESKTAEDGNYYDITLRDGTKVGLKSGVLVRAQDGGVDKRQSGNLFVTMPDGKVKMVAPKDVESFKMAPAADLYEQAQQQIREAYQRQLADDINTPSKQEIADSLTGQPEAFNVGGATVMGTATQVTPDGNVVVQFDEPVQLGNVIGTVHAIPKDEFLKMRAGTVMPTQQVEEQPQEDAQEAAEETEAPEQQEPQQEEETQQEEAQYAGERDFRGRPMPMKEDGRVDQAKLFESDPEAWAEWETKRRNDGGKSAQGYLKGEASRQTKQLNDLQKKFDAEADFDKRDELGEQIAAVQQRIEAITKAAESAEARQKVREARDAEPQTPDEVVAQYLSAYKGSLDKDDFLRETGYSDEDLKGFVGGFVKDGSIGVQRLAEIIKESDDTGLTSNLSDMDIRDAILNVLSQVRSWNDVKNFIKNNRAAMAEEQARQERETIEAAADEESYDYELSEENNEFGKPFVLSSDGTTIFGEIGEDSGLTPAPIKLNEGEDYVDEKGRHHGYGLIHIEEGHGDQIREAGFGSVREFVETVARNYNTIREGNKIADQQTYLLELTDEHNNTVFIELSRDGSYWNVNSAGIYRVTYSKNKKEVKSAPAIGTSTNADADEVNHGQIEGETVTSGDSSLTSSDNKDNEISETSAEISEKQQEIAEAEAEVDTEPTEAQKEAGNYKKGHIKLDGYDISIEQPKGSVRSGTDAQGREWSQVMNNTYGYIRGTEGVDGDHIDVFLSDNPEEGNVYVVDQVNPDGTFDEHKVMYGFPDMEAARAAYLSNYEEGWTGLGAITGVSKEEFKKWIESSHRKTKPFSEYSSVKTEGDVQLGQPVEQESAEMAQEEAVSDQEIPGIAQNTEEAAQPVEEVQEQPQRFGQVHKKAEMMAAALNTPIVVHDDVSTVEDAAAASAINAGEIVKGWMQDDGTVHIYAPNADSLRDVEQTVFHEVVAHKGLREMLGEEGFNELCDRVWDAMDSNLHSIYHRKVLHLKIDKDESLDDFFKRKNRAAADEYMAEIAERMTTEEFEKSDSIWKKIVDFFRDIFHLRGADLEMTDKEISDLLSESYKRLRERKEAEWMQALSEDGRAVISKANEYKRMMLEWMQERDEDKSAANVRQREEMRRDILAQMRQLPDEDLAKIADRYNDFIGQEAREALNRRQILAKTTAVARAVASIQMLHNVKAKPVKKVNLYDYVGKDELRPMLSGVKHEDGYAVATDATVLIADKASYQKEKDGKTIAKDGKEINGVYPDWKMLFAGLSEKIPVDIPAMRDFVASVRDAAAKRWEDAKARGEKSIGTKKDALEKTQVFVKIGDNAYSFRLGRLSLFLDYAATVGATTLMRNGNFMFGFKNDKGMGLIMASLNEFQNDAEFEAERGVEQLGYYSYWPGVEAREPQEATAAEEEPASESQPEEPAAEEDQQPEEEVDEDAEEEETRPEPGSKIRGDSKIDDFGEKIAGARKDLYRDKIRSSKNYSVNDLKEMKDPDKVFSRKNIIKAWADGNMTKDDAQAMLAMNMAARNDGSSDMRALGLAKYRDMAVAWEAGEPVALQITDADVDDIISKLPERVRERSDVRESEMKSINYFITKPFNDYLATYAALDYPAVNRQLKSAYIRPGSHDGRYWVVANQKSWRGYPFGTFDNAVEKMKALFPEIPNSVARVAKNRKEGDKIGNMSVVKDKYGWYRIRSGYIPGEIYLSKKFYNKEEAEKFLKENADMLIDREEKMAEALMGSNIGLVDRQGKDYRQGKDITPQDFLNTFGPRGIQFGEWVPQTERQEYLNKTYDAIMDFCDIVGISPEAFFLGGRLGLAFGARGHSKALAHYEPVMEVINLTRMKGAGSLAHEWFHAMDNYLARKKTGNVGSFATKNKTTERDEVANAFREFVRKMDSMDYTSRSWRAGEYWGDVIERAARLFENYVYNKLGEKGVTSPLLVRKDTLFDDTIERDVASSWPYPSERENAEIKPYFDKLFETIEERVDENTGRTTLFRITKKEDETDLNFLRRVADDLTTKYTNLGRYVNIEDGVEGGDNGDYSDRIVRIFAKPGRDYDSYEETFFHENLHCYLESLGVDSYSPVVIDFLDSFRTNLPDIMGAWEADIREAYKDEGYVESEMFVRIVSDIMSKRVDARILFPFIPEEAMDIIDNYYNAIGYDTAEEKDLGRDEEGGGRDVQPSEGRAAGDLRMVQAESTEEEPGRDTDREIARAVASITGRNEEDVLQDMQDRKDADFITEDTRFRIANQSQEIFVSNAQRALDGIKMEKATPEQWLKMLEKNGGLKAGEDKWLGLSDWLKASEAKTITKQEIADFIAENKIQIEEKRYRDRDDVDQMPENELAKEFSRIYAIDVDGFTGKPFIDSFNILDAIDFYNANHEDQIDEPDDPTDISDADYNRLEAYGEELLRKMESGEFGGDAVIDTTRLGYTTEGLTHNREIALTVPTIEPWNEGDSIHFGDAGHGRAVAWVRFGDTFTERGIGEAPLYVKYVGAEPADEPHKRAIEGILLNWNDNESVMRNERKENQFWSAKSMFENALRDNYYEGTEEQRTLRAQALAALDDIKASDFDAVYETGQRVLFIDEIQSKRHQEGREKGYKKDSENKMYALSDDIRKERKRLSEKYGVSAYKSGKANDVELLEKLDDSEKKRFLSIKQDWDKEARRYETVVIPDAPFEKNWHELAMKRMLRLAAEEGYDYVAWTKGEQQAERYDLGREVKYIRNEGNSRASGLTSITIRLVNDDYFALDVDKEGAIKKRYNGYEQPIPLGEYEGKSLGDVIGKELAVRVLSLDKYGKIEGEGLHIGGEGMKGFYDEMLPRFMNKYGKQWGVKVEDISLTELEGGITAHAVPVTQEMKDSVMDRQTMFRKVYHGSGAEFDKFDHSFMGSGEGNQAFGWGTYVTTNKDTGLAYAKSIGGSDEQYERAIRSIENQKARDEMALTKAKTDAERKYYEDAIAIADLRKKQMKRHLYEVEIPDDNGENYLHWEEPLTGKQSRKIMDAIRKMVNLDEWGEGFEYELQSTLGPGTYGRHVYAGLNYFLGNEYNYATDEDPGAERNSKLLNSLGIVGMEYPIDIMGAKRFEGSNYVIFNDKDLKISGHTRFRIGSASGDLRGRYEERLKKIGFLEAHQDSMLALKVLQEELVKESGKPLQSFENAYLAENQLSSVNSAEKEYYQRQYFDPMIKAVRDVMDAAGMTYGEVVKYAIAKHGLERNQVFHDRDQAASDETIPYRDYSGLTSLFLLDGEDAIDLSEAEARAEQYVDDVENRAGQACANMWGKVKDATKKALYKSWQSGILTRSEYESIRDMFDFYVPLRGFDEETAEQHYEYLDHKSSPFSPALRTAKGRSSIADDPFATIGNMWESTVQQGNNNLVKQNFLNMVLNRPNELVTVKPMWYTYDAAADEWSQAVPAITDGMSKEDIQKEWDDFENRMAQMEQQGLASKKKPNRGKVNIPYRLLNKQDQEHMVVVKSAGREYVLVVNGNPRAAQAINGLTNPDRQDFLAKMAKANRWMAANFTTRSPKFVVRNAFRDTLFSLFSIDIKEDSDYNRAFRGNLMRNYGRIWGLMKRFKAGEFDDVDENTLTETERLFREFMMNGGETGYTQLKRVDEYKKMVNRIVGGAAGEKMHAVKSAWRVVDDMVGFANRCVEDICRLSAYMTSRQMGRSIQTSVANAKEISVNFNKKGSGDGYGSSFARAAYLFYNAGVQGLNNFVNIRKNSRKHWTGLRKFDIRVAEMLALGAMIPFLNNVISAAVGGDDDEYADLPDWIRRNSLVLGGGGFYVTVPLPIELRALYGIGDIAYMSLAGRMKNYNPFQLGVEVIGQIADIMPLNPVEGIVTNKGKNIGEGLILSLVPDVTAPIAQAALNVDFTGKPIYKNTTYNESMPAYTKAYAGTSKVLVRSAELLNRVTGGDEFGPGAIDINPAIVEHLMEGYFGGLLTFAEENAKTVQAIWDEDYRQLRNVPIANILFQKNDERTASSYVNDMYFYYKKEAEETNRRAKGYKAKGDLNKAAEIAGSKEYRRARLFKGTEKRIKKLQDQLKEETDKTRQDYLRRRIADEKEAFIKVLDDKDLD